MGIPSFTRWLGLKYPKCITDTYVLKDLDHGVDNLYIDMNQILHNSIPTSVPNHPNYTSKHLNSDELFETALLKNMVRKLDALLDLVKPNKLLFIAVDGVAPRYVC